MLFQIRRRTFAAGAVGCADKHMYPTPSEGGVRRLITRTFRTSVGGVQRRVSVANPGRVEAPEGGAIRVRAVEHGLDDTGVDRPHLIVGSSKFRLVAGEVGLGLVVVFGRRCHLDRHSRNQQRADNRKSCSLHGRLHFDIGGKCASLCECCVLMRRPLSHQLRPAWPARLRARVAHLTFHGDLTAIRVGLRGTLAVPVLAGVILILAPFDGLSSEYAAHS